jgi:hypothetical protein
MSSSGENGLKIIGGRKRRDFAGETVLGRKSNRVTRRDETEGE